MSRTVISLADRPTLLAESSADWRRPFHRLDALLADAVAEARLRFGADAGHDSFRGLYLTDEVVAAALAHPPVGPFAAAARSRPLEPSWDEIAAHHRGWAWLRDTVGLTDIELDVILIALGPEADLRYERLYGYLQDDVSRRRPTVSLLLDLISSSADEKLAHRALFAPDAGLLAGRLVRLVADDRTPAPPLLAHVVALDEQITGILLVPGGLDRQLAAHCRLTRPDRGAWAGTPVPPADRDRVLDVARALPGRQALRVHLYGPAGSGKRAAAEALAGELGMPALTLRTAHLPDVDEEAVAVVARAFREAVLHGALMVVDEVDRLVPGSRRAATLLQCLAGHDGITVLTGTQPWTATGESPLGVLEIVLGRPDPDVRRAAWTRHLDLAGTDLSGDLAQTLADRFSFGPGRIAEAVSSAVASAGIGRPTAEHVFAAARRQTSHQLATLARRIEPVTTWSDLVLPADTAEHLTDLCDRVRLRSTVLHGWGFDRKLTRGRGTTALFTGPPGTGKTSAAEVIAGELGLDLFAIDLSTVVSKYIGETEKNLERIFSAAAEADAILMFDEADALFGKRSEVHDAHDRYANIETSYLLQRMEQYEGIAILATNLRQNLDEAFTRRLQFVVDFPFPDESQRTGIWRVCFPGRAPLAADVDMCALGRDFRLTGAEIKNAALHAAYLAAARGEPIGTAVLHMAVRREFQKMGRVPPEPAAGW